MKTILRAALSFDYEYGPKKVAAVMAQIWGIGERKFGGDWERRMMMFNVLVKSIFMYGVEIWGWEEREKLESLQARYQMDIRFGKIHAKIHNSERDKSGTDQHRGRIQGFQISRKDKK